MLPTSFNHVLGRVSQCCRSSCLSLQSRMQLGRDEAAKAFSFGVSGGALAVVGGALWGAGMPLAAGLVVAGGVMALTGFTVGTMLCCRDRAGEEQPLQTPSQ